MTDIKTKKRISIKSIILKALIAFFAVLLLIILFTLLVYFVELKSNEKSKKRTLPLFNVYVIVSPSMEPKINVKDAVIVRRIKPQKLKKNDIITFVSKSNKYQGLTITHRIIDVKKEGKKYYFKTKGDNNNAPDNGYITSDDIYGKTILILPKLGYLQTFLGNAYGWILLVLFPCIVVIIIDIIKLYEMITSGIKRTVYNKVGKRKEYEKLVKEVDPICYIKGSNKKYYDLASVIKIANKENKDTTIVFITTEYHMHEKIEINNIHKKKIIFTTADDILICNIYKKTISDLIIKTELVLDGVVVLNKKK